MFKKSLSRVNIALNLSFDMDKSLTSQSLSSVEYERLMLERRNIGFDELINESATINDIDFEKVKAYAKIDDRIEVESPGKLLNGVTLRNLEGSHVLRNEKIANLLYDIGYIEKWGTGIRRMKELMKEHGLKEPLFEQSNSFFKVYFMPLKIY